jgi:hypothetical protein
MILLSLIEIRQLIPEKILKDFFSLCKHIPHCGPIQPPGTMIYTNLNLHYIMKLLCKSELFWLCGSLGEIV